MIVRLAICMLALPSFFAVTPSIEGSLSAGMTTVQDTLRSRKTVTVFNADSAGEAMAEAERKNPGWTAVDAKKIGKRLWKVTLVKD